MVMFSRPLKHVTVYCCASATETSFGNITEGVVLFFEKLALSIGQVDGSSGG